MLSVQQPKLTFRRSRLVQHAFQADAALHLLAGLQCSHPVRPALALPLMLLPLLGVAGVQCVPPAGLRTAGSATADACWWLL